MTHVVPGMTSQAATFAGSWIKRALPCGAAEPGTSLIDSLPDFVDPRVGPAVSALGDTKAAAALPVITSMSCWIWAFTASANAEGKSDSSSIGVLMLMSMASVVPRLRAIVNPRSAPCRLSSQAPNAATIAASISAKS
jgi:hypothetical protein